MPVKRCQFFYYTYFTHLMLKLCVELVLMHYLVIMWQLKACLHVKNIHLHLHLVGTIGKNLNMTKRKNGKPEFKKKRKNKYGVWVDSLFVDPNIRMLLQSQRLTKGTKAAIITSTRKVMIMSLQQASGFLLDTFRRRKTSSVLPFLDTGKHETFYTSCKSFVYSHCFL